jgi:hypothetical protein
MHQVVAKCRVIKVAMVEVKVMEEAVLMVTIVILAEQCLTHLQLAVQLLALFQQ